MKQGRNFTATDARPLSKGIFSFASLRDPSEAVIANLADTCEKDGFFILTDHPVPIEILDRVCVSSQNFFSLPESEVAPFYQRKQCVTP